MATRSLGAHLPVGQTIRCGWVIALLTLLCTPTAQAAPPRPLVRSIPVAGAPYQVLVDRPTGAIVVLGYTAVSAGMPALPAALTILNGTTGARLLSYQPVGGLSSSAQAVAPVGGSGRVYFSLGHGLETWTPSGTPRPAAVTLPAYSAGRVAADERLGRFFAGSVGDTVVRAIDARTGKTVASLPISPYDDQGLVDLAVDAPSGLLFIASQSNLVAYPAVDLLTVLDDRSGRVRARRTIAQTTLLASDQAAHRLLAYGNPVWNMPGPQPSSQVQTIDTRTLALLATVAVGPVYYPGVLAPSNEASPDPMAIDDQAGVAVAISVSSDQYTTGQGTPGMATLINVRSGQVLRRVPVGTEPYAVAVDSWLHRAYIANRGDGSVTVLDTRTGALVARVWAGAGPVSVAVDEHAGTVFVASPEAANASSGGAGTGGGELAMFAAAITGNHA